MNTKKSTTALKRQPEIQLISVNHQMPPEQKCEHTKRVICE
jgi:hypothetical protein